MSGGQRGGAITGATYVGSYKDSETRALPNVINSGSASYTVETCKQAALSQGKQYFGLQAMQPNNLAQCFVGNDYNAAVAQGVATTTTTGPDGNVYGGNWTNAIYKVDPTADPSVLKPIRYVKFRYPDNSPDCIQISQVAIYDTNNVNIALRKPVAALNSWTGVMSDKDYVVNGNLAAVNYGEKGGSGFASRGGPGEYLTIDLQAEVAVKKIVYYNRLDYPIRGRGMLMDLMDGSSNVIKEITLTADMIQSYDFKVPAQPLKIRPIRYVNVLSASPGTCIQISQVAVYSIENPSVNIAQGKPTKSQGAYSAQAVASNAVDGTLAPRAYPNIYHSPCGTGDYWQVDLGSEYPVSKIVYYNRQDCCQDRAQNLILSLRTGNNDVVVWEGPFTSADMVQTFLFNPIVNITDPYRFMPVVDQCKGYATQVQSGPEYEKSFFQTQIADVCMPYYSTALDKCQQEEQQKMDAIDNKIAKCAATLDTCQTAFAIDTQGKIISAHYGNKGAKKLLDVKAVIDKKRTEGTNNIIASNTFFGTDPAPGLPKALYITIHTSYNADQTYMIPENKSINLDSQDAPGGNTAHGGLLPAQNAGVVGTSGPNRSGGAGSLTFATLGQGQNGGGNQRGGWMAFNEPNFVREMLGKPKAAAAPDRNVKCKTWAAKRPSECNITPSFMTVNCATSCAAVGEGAPVKGDLQGVKYSIQHHGEFPEFLKRYKPKSECPDKRYVKKADVAPVFDQTLRLIEKLNDLKANYSTDIRNHPDYKLLLDKYAIKGPDGSYQACTKC